MTMCQCGHEVGLHIWVRQYVSECQATPSCRCGMYRRLFNASCRCGHPGDNHYNGGGKCQMAVGSRRCGCNNYEEQEKDMEESQPTQEQPQEQPQQEQPTEQAQESQQGLVSLGVVLDIAGDQMEHGNGPRWHRLLVSPDMARALFAALAPMFTGK